MASRYNLRARKPPKLATMPAYIEIDDEPDKAKDKNANQFSLMEKPNCPGFPEIDDEMSFQVQLHMMEDNKRKVSRVCMCWSGPPNIAEFALLRGPA